MPAEAEDHAPPAPRRLSKADRRQQLLNVALAIVREEGADRLTLGHLAVRAGVSKPVTYDHFGTRSGLLIELYRWIDTERVHAFRDAMATGKRSRVEAIQLLAEAYIRCAADMTDEFHMIGAALTGSEDKVIVYQELLDQSVEMFVAVLAPFDPLPEGVLKRRCIGLVGAGEALSAAIVRGSLAEADAIAAFVSLIRGSMDERVR